MDKAGIALFAIAAAFWICETFANSGPWLCLLGVLLFLGSRLVRQRSSNLEDASPIRRRRKRTHVASDPDDALPPAA